MTKANTILEYLQHIGAKKEAEMYLRLFKSVESHRFAIIAIDAQTLAIYERDIATALAYIAGFGLTPVVLHDATGALGKQLVSDIWSGKAKCQAIMASLYNSSEEAAKSLAAKVIEIVHAKTIPIIEAENTSETLNQLLHIIKPGKLVFLNKFGGVRTEKGELLSYINLPHEYEKVSKAIAEDYKQILQAASQTMAGATWNLNIEIVPPDGLLNELFTIKGSGTFIKKGPRILKLGASKVNKAKIKKVLEQCFGKKLSKNYLKNESGVTFFVEENYKGIAVVNSINGIHYLDKLAVLPELQGEGLARDIITSVMNNCKKVFWRSRPENQINDWYLRLCSGMQKMSKWYVYWSNLNFEEINQAVRYASKKPSDFVS